MLSVYTDRVSVDEFVAASEAACRGGDASEWLVSFRKHPSALETAKSVLEASTNSLAQFQAILVIRDVIVTHWDGLTPEQRELRTQLLAFLLAAYDRSAASTAMWHAAPSTHTRNGRETTQ